MKTVISPEVKRKHIYLHQGIVYDTQPILNGEMRDLHVSLLSPVGHRTKDTKKYPCMVWVCGGAWRGGRERAAEMLPELMYLAEEGIIVAAAEYRIIGEAVFPAQISDVLTAVRFLRINAEKYHIDPERIGIIGSSAGGHLTLLAANNDGQFDTQTYSSVSSHVRCAVDLYGIADIEAIYRFNLNAVKQGKRPGRSNVPEEFPECMMLGGLPSDIPETAKRAGGINGIREHTCPVLVMHGSEDRAVNIEQSEMYYHAMAEAGKDISYYVLKGADHGSDEFFQEETREIIRRFLREKL